MLKEQHMPESVGEVSKMSAQSTILPRHSQRLSKCCCAIPGSGEHGRAEYLDFWHVTMFSKPSIYLNTRDRLFWNSTVGLEI